jgi:phage protein D
VSVVNLLQESRDQGHFRIPQFEVRIEGAGLPRDVLRDVQQVTYKDDIRAIDSFELLVSNWDPTTRQCKYIGAETAQSLRGDSPETQRVRLFEPCRREVELRMGYVGGAGLVLMMKGTFTTMEPNFPAAGPPTLTVRGLNVLHQLRRKQHATAWVDKTDSAIAKEIGQLTETIRGRRRKRFPYPVVTDPNVDEKPIAYVAQKNEYDIDFLLARARQRGYVVFVREGDPNGRGAAREKHVYFGPSTGEVAGLRDVTFQLAWGVSLVDFKPTLTTANQIKSVTVNGWNRNTRKPISETVDLDDPRLNVNRDLRALLNACDPREEYVVDEPVFTPAQAKERARAILLDRYKTMVKCSGTTVGLPDLRAGQRVQIARVGARLEGTYFVTATTHTIGERGYVTKFEARREETGRQGTP